MAAAPQFTSIRATSQRPLRSLRFEALPLPAHPGASNCPEDAAIISGVRPLFPLFGLALASDAAIPRRDAAPRLCTAVGPGLA